MKCYSGIGLRFTGGQSRSGGSEIFSPKSLFSRDLVSCWTDSGLLKSNCPFDFNLQSSLALGSQLVLGWAAANSLSLNAIDSYGTGKTSFSRQSEGMSVSAYIFAKSASCSASVAKSISSLYRSLIVDMLGCRKKGWVWRILWEQLRAE
jgi:hypothetical protein